MKHSIINFFFIGVFICAFGAEPAVNGNPSIQITLASLTVNITPQEAVDAGAQWSPDDTNWYNSGESVYLPSGDYTISFSTIPGYQTPGERQVSMGTSSVSITQQYLPLPYLSQWQILYSNPSSDVEPEFYASYIYIPPGPGSGTLKIVPRPGVDPDPINLSVLVDGSLNILYSRMTLHTVLVTGKLTKLIIPDGFAWHIEAHNVGAVRQMAKARSMSSNYSHEFATSIFSGTPPVFPLSADSSTPPSGKGVPMNFDNPCTALLIGVSLLDFEAPEQDVAIIMSPKKHRWQDQCTKAIYNDLSLARIRLTDDAFLAGSFRKIQTYGGIDIAKPDSEAIRCLGFFDTKTGPVTQIVSRTMTGIYRERLPDDPGMGRVYTLDSSIRLFGSGAFFHSDHLFIATTGGNIDCAQIRTTGDIPLLMARRGYINVDFVGAGYESEHPSPNIRRIIGEYGVEGDFCCGVQGGVPAHTGNIMLIRTSPSAIVTGNAWTASDRTRVLTGINNMVFHTD
ncbi:MAG: hypothetical protein ACOCVL_00665 [Candidatus Sumerlaeota bacterium]